MKVLFFVFIVTFTFAITPTGRLWKRILISFDASKFMQVSLKTDGLCVMKANQINDSAMIACSVNSTCYITSQMDHLVEGETKCYASEKFFSSNIGN